MFLLLFVHFSQFCVIINIIITVIIINIFAIIVITTVITIIFCQTYFKFSLP